MFYSGRDRFTNVLLKEQVVVHGDCSTTFAQVQSFFSLNDTLWAVVRLYVFADRTFDHRVLCPWVALSDHLAILPVSSLSQPIQIITDLTSPEKDWRWVNVWLTIGAAPFPERERERIFAQVGHVELEL
jgi:hypothetical protein